jgi:hypothetical protein
MAYAVDLIGVLSMAPAPRRLVLVLVALLALTSAGPVFAEPPATRAMLERWQRTDLPIAAGQVSRTWLWGPDAFTGGLLEPYRESPDGQRLVQYYDKSRMEISRPGDDSASPWYVTNGLLVVELMTGRLQLGDNAFEQHEPAPVNVAGDAGDPNGVTYAAFAAALTGLPNDQPRQSGATITAKLAWQGEGEARTLSVSEQPDLGQHGATYTELVPETGKYVASPFWAFMTNSGLVYENGVYLDAPLFLNPYYATGLPVTDPYWTEVLVGGEPKQVLLQCFERRCLTFTPSNAPEWQVESGNVGRHYHEWRYATLGLTPVAAPVPATGDVQIVSVVADPPEGSTETVELRNRAATPVDMTGWRLQDVAGNTYTFPNFVIGIDATVRVHLCGGTNTATDLYWERCAAVWNNDGDTAYLYDASGALVSSLAY